MQFFGKEFFTVASIILVLLLSSTLSFSQYNRLSNRVYSYKSKENNAQQSFSIGNSTRTDDYTALPENPMPLKIMNTSFTNVPEKISTEQRVKILRTFKEGGSFQEDTKNRLVTDKHPDALSELHNKKDKSFIDNSSDIDEPTYPSTQKHPTDTQVGGNNTLSRESRKGWINNLTGFDEDSLDILDRNTQYGATDFDEDSINTFHANDFCSEKDFDEDSLNTLHSNDFRNEKDFDEDSLVKSYNNTNLNERSQDESFLDISHLKSKYNESSDDAVNAIARIVKSRKTRDIEQSTHKSAAEVGASIHKGAKIIAYTLPNNNSNHRVKKQSHYRMENMNKTRYDVRKISSDDIVSDNNSLNGTAIQKPDDILFVPFDETFQSVYETHEFEINDHEPQNHLNPNDGFVQYEIIKTNESKNKNDSEHFNNVHNLGNNETTKITFYNILIDKNLEKIVGNPYLYHVYNHNYTDEKEKTALENYNNSKNLGTSTGSVSEIKNIAEIDQETDLIGDNFENIRDDKSKNHLITIPLAENSDLNNFNNQTDISKESDYILSLFENNIIEESEYEVLCTFLFKKFNTHQINSPKRKQKKI